MATTHSPNTACCTIPPVQSSYQPNGTMKSYAGFQKVYVTGPEGTGRALIGVYDAFGFYPQTLQGADILAKTLNVKVVLPDFFEPHAPLSLSCHPADTPDKKAQLQAFFCAGGPADFEKAVTNVTNVAEVLKAEGTAHVVVYGYCWGGKVAMLAGANPRFDAVAGIHPSLLNATDADNLAVPLGFFLSKDEPIAEYEKLFNSVSTKPFAAKNAYKLYPVHHGWAAARANLDDLENKKQYEDLYSTLAGFIKGVWEI